MPWCELHEGAGAKVGVGLLLGQQSPAESQQNRAGEVGGGRDEVPRSGRFTAAYRAHEVALQLVLAVEVDDRDAVEVAAGVPS